MKKLFTTMFLLLFGLLAYTQTFPTNLFTSDFKHEKSLNNTVWKSSIDGERIFFLEIPGSGKFENGIEFDYEPQRKNNNWSDTPIYISIYVNGKPINKLKLLRIKNFFYLVDKRNIMYKEVI